jgi:hypothetical protein
MVETTGKPRKVVGRTVAIVLAIVCVILSAGLIATIVVYLPSASTINRLNSENAGLEGNMTSLNQQILNLQNMLSQRDGTISDKDSQISSLNNQLSGLNNDLQSVLNVLYMNASATLLSTQEFSLAAGENSSMWEAGVDYLGLDYAGYVVVSVGSSSDTTFVQIVYSGYGINFDETKIVGTSGSAGFPVLPNDNINIIIGNTELVDSVNGTIVVTYYY